MNKIMTTSTNDNIKEEKESIKLIKSEKKIKSRFGGNDDDVRGLLDEEVLEVKLASPKKKRKRTPLLILIRRHLTLRYFIFTFGSFFTLYLLYHYLSHRKEIKVVKSGISHHKIITNEKYDEIISFFNLNKSIEHDSEWCLRGPKDPSCFCDNPFVAKSRSKIRHWEQSHHFNKDDVFKAAARKEQNNTVDIVFLGDSITEEWKGTRFRFPVLKKKDIPAVFEQLFTKKGGGLVEAVPLGISGDTSPNLLWRIQNGELPDFFNPPVIWLLIGTNDFGNTWCNADIVFLGIRRIIDYIRSRKANSTLVVNSILPRTFHKKGYVNRVQFVKHKKHQSMGPNLWREIQFVNEELKFYIQNTRKDDHKLLYYDASDLFFINSNAGEINLRIDQTLMEDFLHPTALGHLIWGKAIVKYVQNLQYQQ